MFPFPGGDLLVKVLALALIAGALLGTGYVYGIRSEAHRHTEYVAAEAAARVALVERQGAATQEVVIRYVDRFIETKGVNETITREVTKYVESNPGACAVDAEWVRLHDAAATGSVPRTPGIPPPTAPATPNPR